MVRLFVTLLCVRSIPMQILVQYALDPEVKWRLRRGYPNAEATCHHVQMLFLMNGFVRTGKAEWR